MIAYVKYPVIAYQLSGVRYHVSDIIW